MQQIFRFATALIIVFLATGLFAQKSGKKPSKSKAPAETPSVGMRLEKPLSYADSAEFTKAFKQFYPLVKQKNTVRELAQKQVERMIAGFRNQGMDSAEIAKVAYAGLDENAAYKIYYDVYRQYLSAKEMEAYVAFLKTPEGTKIFSIMPELQRPQSEVMSYVSKTVNTNLTPIRLAAQEKSTKAQKEQHEKMMSDTTESGRQYRQQQQLRDSLLKSRGLSPVAPIPSGQ